MEDMHISCGERYPVDDIMLYRCNEAQVMAQHELFRAAILSLATDKKAKRRLMTKLNARSPNFMRAKWITCILQGIDQVLFVGEDESCHEDSDGLFSEFLAALPGKTDDSHPPPGEASARGSSEKNPGDSTDVTEVDSSSSYDDTGRPPAVPVPVSRSCRGDDEKDREL